MHRDVRIGIDAVDLQLHEVLRQRPKAGIVRGQPILVLLERDQHLVDDVFRKIGTRVIGEQDRHALNLLHADRFAERILRVNGRKREAASLELRHLVGHGLTTVTSSRISVSFQYGASDAPEVV